MEAVPRLPMVCFDLKISPDRPPTDFSKLKQYIRDFYNEDPETYSAEIRNIEALRAQAVHPVKDVNGCAILKKYYCQLHFMESRFPMSKDGPASVAFTWRDTYSGMVSTVMDIKYEIVAILYNIGALHSQMGAFDDRTSPEGLKMACSHFQCAAWAFQHIKDSYAQPSGMDLSPDLMQFMYQLCLAQAQECILEKSMTDNRKATINARVATQIVDYYNLAQNALIQGGNEDSALIDVVGSKLMKNWKRYVRFKSTYYSCVSLLYQGMQSEEQQKMGERVAYFQAALDKLNDAMKLSKGLDQAEAITESLMFTRDVVECKRKAAKSENEYIYHEGVVDIDSLPSIKGASLVKGMSFNINDVDVSGPDIFARLVPMKAHEASSLYSEEKAKLLRKINGLIDAKDEEVVSFMSCLQLDHLKAHLEPDSLPQEVVDRCAALSVKPDAIPNLIAAMDKLNDAYHDVDAMLLEIMELIKVEEKNEKEYQEIMGSRAPSIVATDLTREANKYMEAHKKAADSNETLNRAMSQHVENLRVLQQSLPELQAQLPTLAPFELENNESLKEVTLLVSKVDEMRKQRAMFASQLRESICSDDITTILVTRSSDNFETLFEEELKKHERYVKLIEQNLSAQENILKALTDAYARYAPTRKATATVVKQRELMLSALVSSYDAYEDLIAKSSKGMEFYRKLETNLTKLLQRVKGTCKVQQEEREAILAKNNIKIAPDPVIIPEVSSTGPKLKDYLQKRKEAQAFGGGYPVGYSVEPGQNWLPGVRPAPVGSEVTQPVVSSSKPHEYSTQANAYSGANMTPYQQPYSAYQTPYGQTVPVPYQPPLNNLQYPSISDPSLAVDSAPTAPYRPDSRASTSSDHSSISQQHQSTLTPAAPVVPSPDPRVSPVHGVDCQMNNTNQVVTSGKSDQLNSAATGSNLGQNPYGNYMQGTYPYQGYSYPTNYNPYGPQTVGAINPVVTNPYSVPSTTGASTQVSVTYSTQPSNVSIIQVNSGGGSQQQNIPPTANPNIANSQATECYSAVSTVKANTSLGNSSSNYYDPSLAKAMSVPSASYNGPYGSNTITSPYADYYVSQVYNGNVSSIATSGHQHPASSPPPVSQASSSVYTPANSSQPNYVPVNNNQVPTTTYTVPANQQFHSTNQSSKSNYPSSTQAYVVPSLVSPTQTTFNIANDVQSHFPTGQAVSDSSDQSPYSGSSVSSSVSGQTTVNTSDSTNSTLNHPNASSAVQYPYGQTQLSYPAQYSNYYYNRGQAVPGYTAQSGQMQYSQYAASFTQQNQPGSYPSGQTNVTNPYGTASSSQTNIANPYGSATSGPTNVSNPYGTASTGQANVANSYGNTSSGQTNIANHYGNTSSGQTNVANPYGSTPSGQANITNPYGTPSSVTHPYGSASLPYSNYAYQAQSYLSTSNQIPTTSASSNNQGAVNYSQNQATNYSQQPLQQTHPAVTSPQVQPSQISYPQSVAGYNQSNVQQYQSTPQQHVQPGSYMQTAQPQSYIDPRSGILYGQQSYNTGQIIAGGYPGYSSTHQTSMPVNTGQPLANQTSNTITSQVQPVSSQQPESKSSNIDLLAGLDFTVSDAPLQPLPQPIPVSQISDTLSSMSLDTKSSTELPQSTVNGETKTQVEPPATEIKLEEKIPPTSVTPVKTEEQGLKLSRDPFTETEALNQFVQEVDKFEKFVEGLCEKTLSGPTPLDIKWSELQDLQEKDAHRQNISVARCYPMKNRFPDILPYDNSTVELPSTKDDYINASFVKDMCGGCPDFILTQAPLPSTYADFWTMILEQHIELVVCLLSDSQMNGEIYWPVSKTDDLTFGPLKVSLQSCNAKSFWVERIISVSNNKLSRVVVHLQFTAWPNSWFPESPGPWLQLVGESLSVWRGCRNPDACIVVHCDAGVGRSGLFVVTAAALSEMLLSPHIPEMVPIAASLAKWRKNPLRDRDHLKFAYQIILYYCQDVLMKRGILSSKGTFEEKRSKGKSHTRHPSQDFLLNSTTHNSSSEERRHSDASSTGSKMSEMDPLNQLDPLWQLKRNS